MRAGKISDPNDPSPHPKDVDFFYAVRTTDGQKVKINLESSEICLPFVVENLKSKYQDISAVADADGLKSADIEKS